MRIEGEQLRHQKNIESITLQALPHLNSGARPADVDDDWLTHFFEFSRNVSADDMQSMWARMLAGEFNAPQSFSKRTLRLAADLDRTDAKLFTSVCRVAVYIRGYDSKSSTTLRPLVYPGPVRGIYSDLIPLGSLGHLECIGLIRFSYDPAGFHLPISAPTFAVEYFGSEIILRAGPYQPNGFPTGEVALTETGRELARIAGATPAKGFLEYLLGRWRGSVVQPDQESPEAQPGP
jgi:hypothetical protein